MILLTAFSKFNRWAGPALVRQALSLRAALGLVGEAPWLDSLLLYPPTRIVSIEVHHRYRELRASSDVPASSLNAREHSRKRLSILESFWGLAVLAEPRRWSAWSHHSRFKKLLRAEVLWAKHGWHVAQALLAGLDKSPQLRPNRGAIFGDDGDKARLLSRLPASAQLVHALDLEDWTPRKDTVATTRTMRRLAHKVGGSFHSLRGGALCLVELPDDPGAGAVAKATATDTSEAAAPPPPVPLSALSLEDALELAGGHVKSCGPLNALCERLDLYQVWTQEYVERLGHYLKRRLMSLQSEETGARAVVLDVGAGDGLLVQLLSDYFANHPAEGCPQNIRLVATDDGSWNISPRAPVERLSVEQALEKYAPHPRPPSKGRSDEGGLVIVLCSWMPMGVDWTALFRRHNVDEYVLLGECDDGQCGHNWHTWGNPHFIHDDDDDAEGDEDGPPSEDAVGEALPKHPYEADGYRRVDLDHLAPFQFSRFDCRVSRSGRTVSFRRRVAAPP